MDRHSFLALVQQARARGGATSGTALRQEALDNALEGELLAERAGSLAALGRRLDLALARLGELEEQAAAAQGQARAELVAAHAEARRALVDARWEMKVVREALGLRGVRQELDRFWPVPPPLR